MTRRARGAAARRSAQPEVPCIWDQFRLDDASPSGLTYVIKAGWFGDMRGPKAGYPREVDYPPDNPMKGQCTFPPSWTIPVLVGYEGEDLGGFSRWDPVLEPVEAGVVRAILREHAEEIRLIQALERHLGVA